jgi:hypothetical protein
MIIENVLNVEDLDEKLKNKYSVVIIFQNSTCDICRIRSVKLSGIISKLAHGIFEDLLCIKVDTARSQFDHYNYDLHISTHPTIIIFKEQREVFRFHTIQNFEQEIQTKLLDG